MSNKSSKFPYAIICKEHGRVFIDEQDYTRQIMRPDSPWQCPICKDVAEFDEENYESYFDDNAKDDIAF